MVARETVIVLWIALLGASWAQATSEKKMGVDGSTRLQLLEGHPVDFPNNPISHPYDISTAYPNPRPMSPPKTFWNPYPKPYPKPNHRFHRRHPVLPSVIPYTELPLIPHPELPHPELSLISYSELPHPESSINRHPEPLPHTELSHQELPLLSLPEFPHPELPLKPHPEPLLHPELPHLELPLIPPPELPHPEPNPILTPIAPIPPLKPVAHPPTPIEHQSSKDSTLPSPTSSTNADIFEGTSPSSAFTSEKDFPEETSASLTSTTEDYVLEETSSSMIYTDGDFTFETPASLSPVVVTEKIPFEKTDPYMESMLNEIMIVGAVGVIIALFVLFIVGTVYCHRRKSGQGKISVELANFSAARK